MEAIRAPIRPTEMPDDTSDAPSTPQTQETWPEREKRLLDWVSGLMAYNLDLAEQARWWHYRLSVIVLGCSVLAPIATSVSVLKWNDDIPELQTWAAIAAMALTTTVALAEGIRRIFRFQSRFGACYQAREKLRLLREKYNDERIGLEIGSEEWRKLFTRFRQEIETVLSGVVGDYTTLSEVGAKTPAPSKDSI